jgi:predicted acyl esterase
LLDSWLGDQDGQDGYDAIEYIASLDWCVRARSPRQETAGSHIAAQQPPHLAAFAPWEGARDFYRDTMARGGAPYPYDTMWGLLMLH